MRNWMVGCGVLVALLGTAAAHAATPPPGLDAYVHRSMRQWQVPGLAVAVVKDGKLVLARGYGVRKLGSPGKVDADTLFDIGSNTKAFTAAALGTLVSAGKLGWDARVVDHLKDFRLGDAYVTQHLTLRDLLTHRSGFCDPGAAWYTSNDSDMLERIRYQKPRYGFRAHFCYNNMTYLAAARFIPAITGTSWNRYVAEHIFKPLGMSRSVSTSAAVNASTDVASPHGLVDDKPAVIARYWAHNMDYASPVGGIYSSANDMSHWMLMLLDNGRYHGRQVLAASVIQAMETPQIPVAAESETGKAARAWAPGGHFYSYGLGLFLQDYAGKRMVWHAGDIDGMASAMALVPGRHLGIVVMTNMDHSPIRAGVMMYLLQAYLGQPHRDTGAALYALQLKREKAAKAEQARLDATRKPHQPTPVPLERYVGNYADKLDGTARVSLEHGQLVVQLGNPAFTGPLVHWHDDTFRVAWHKQFYGKAFVTFAQDLEGNPYKLSIPQAKLHYQRVPGGGRGAGTSGKH